MCLYFCLGFRCGKRLTVVSGDGIFLLYPWELRVFEFVALEKGSLFFLREDVVFRDEDVVGDIDEEFVLEERFETEKVDLADCLDSRRRQARSHDQEGTVDLIPFHLWDDRAEKREDATT